MTLYELLLIVPALLICWRLVYLLPRFFITRPVK